MKNRILKRLSAINLTDKEENFLFLLEDLDFGKATINDIRKELSNGEKTINDIAKELKLTDEKLDGFDLGEDEKANKDSFSAGTTKALKDFIKDNRFPIEDLKDIGDMVNSSNTAFFESLVKADSRKEFSADVYIKALQLNDQYSSDKMDKLIVYLSNVKRKVSLNTLDYFENMFLPADIEKLSDDRFKHTFIASGTLNAVASLAKVPRSSELVNDIITVMVDFDVHHAIANMVYCYLKNKNNMDLMEEFCEEVPRADKGTEDDAAWKVIRRILAENDRSFAEFVLDDLGIVKKFLNDDEAMKDMEDLYEEYKGNATKFKIFKDCLADGIIDEEEISEIMFQNDTDREHFEDEEEYINTYSKRNKIRMRMGKR
jgi:hypothetical protein